MINFLKPLGTLLALAVACGLGCADRDGKAGYSIKSDTDFIARKKICLTFDDGPTAVTEQILDTLKDNGITATFFVVGKNVKRNPQILKHIFREGHTVGIHSYSHEYKSIYLSPEALKEDINACFCAIKGVNCDYLPKFYRFPGGSFGLSEGLKNVPAEMGLRYVDWNAACRDSEIKADLPDELTQYALSTAAGKNNVILLLHDAADKYLTADALPDIIREFRSKGYYFTDIDGMQG